jgi:hypothetical protein
VTCQKVEPLPFHLAAAAAIDAPHLQLQEYPRVPAGQITHLADLAIVPAHLDPAATSARRFFERRRSVITRAFGSPKIPRTIGSARKPVNEYVSQSRRRRFDARAIQNSCQIPAPSKCRIPLQSPALSGFQPQNRPLDSTKTLYSFCLEDAVPQDHLVRAIAGFSTSPGCMPSLRLIIQGLGDLRSIRCL